MRTFKNFIKLSNVALIATLVLSTIIPGYAFTDKLNKAVGKQEVTYPEWSVAIPVQNNSGKVLVLELGEDGKGKPTGKIVEETFVITAKNANGAEVMITVKASKPEIGKQYSAPFKGKAFIQGKKKLGDIAGVALLKFTEHGEGFSKGVFITGDVFQPQTPFKVEVLSSVKETAVQEETAVNE